MTSKIAYLTIDDAPTKDMRPKIDYLIENNIPAIFFCIGEFMEQRPEPVIYAIQNGFIVANHTYDHPHCSDASLENVLEQITKTDDIIEDLYKKAGVERPAKYFRFPFGDKGALTRDDVYAPLSEEGAARKQVIQKHLRDLGYTQPAFENVTYQYYRERGWLVDVDWYWTYDTLDWSVYADDPLHGVDSLEAAYARMDKDLPERGLGLNNAESEEIVLIHDHESSTEIFPLLINRMVEKGLQFKLP